VADEPTEESVSRLGNASSQRTMRDHPFNSGARQAPLTISVFSLGAAADLCAKSGNLGRPMTLVQDKSRHALVRGRWSLSVALVVVFSVVMNTYGQHSTAAQKALPTLTTAARRTACSLTKQATLPRSFAGRRYLLRPDTDPKTGAFFACDSTSCICVLVPRGPFFLSGRAP